MSEGINESLQENNDLLQRALTALGKVPEAVNNVKTTVKKTTEEFRAMAEAAEAVHSSSSGVRGNDNVMGWLSRISFGNKGAKQAPAPTGPPSGDGGGGGGGGGTPPPNAGGSRFGLSDQARGTIAVAGGAAAAAGAGLWTATPGMPAAVARQQGLFMLDQMQSSSSSPLTPDTMNATNAQLRSLMGDNLSGTLDDIAAASMTRYRGFGMGSSEFTSSMTGVGNLYAVSGMSNPMAMQGMMGLYNAQGGSSLASVGMFTHDLNTGRPKDMGQIADEIWSRGGWDSRNVTTEEFEASLGGGYLGATLQELFGHDPATYSAVVEAMRLKQRAGGRSGIKWNAQADDPNSAQAVADAMGDPSLAPHRVMGDSNAERRDNLDQASEGLYSGWAAAEATIQTFNSALTEATKALGPFADALYFAKGYTQNFSSSSEGAGAIQFASGLLPLPYKMMLGMSTGGDTAGAVTSVRGSSTSDSIPAMLSRGEYVINARSASILGKDYLDRLNSTGQEFGTAFTQPVKFLSSGGIAEHGYTKHTVEQCVDGACAGKPTLDGWTALGYGDPALKKFSVSGSSLGLTVLERDGIGQYLANFAAAWQAHPDLGGADLNLNTGSSYGHALRPAAQGSGISNHAAGVAIDLRHDSAGFPFMPNTYQATGSEKAAIKELLNRFPKLEWGGDWSMGSIDEMHFEIESPGAWGTGGHVGAEAEEDKPSATPSQTPKVSGVMASTGSLGGGPESLMNPMLAAQGISARWARAFSLAPYGRQGNLLATISHSLLPGMLAGSALTLFGGSAAMMGSVGESGVGADESTAAATEDSSIDYSINAAGGSGPEWLYQFLVAKGARGGLLRQLWTIAMRESGGNPNLVAAMSRGRFTYPDVPSDFDPNSESWRGGRYDVGLFQINSQHLASVKSKFGDMLSMVDPNKNFQMMGSLSGEFQNWQPWGITGFSKDSISYIDWSTWGPNWTGPGGWGETTEERTNEFWNQFQEYNQEGYSKGAWRTKSEVAQIHEGEMIIPATAAEEFRKMMREAVSGTRAGSGDVQINLRIERASEEEAVRFAHKVKQILQDDARLETMRTR